MDEITAAETQQAFITFPYTLDIHVDHAEADNFRRLIKACEDIKVLGLDEVAEDHIRLVIGCTDEVMRDRLRDAW
jgi:hypothetical protein